jgi:hypothetical protein
MPAIHLRPIDIERAFGQLAALFTSEQLETTTETGFKEDYERRKAHIFRLMAAESAQGELLPRSDGNKRNPEISTTSRCFRHLWPAAGLGKE